MYDFSSGLRITMGHRRPGDSYSKYRAPHVLALSHAHPGARTHDTPGPKPIHLQPPPQAPKQVTAQAFQSRVGSSRQGRGGAKETTLTAHVSNQICKGTKDNCTSRGLAHEAQANERRQRKGNVHSPTAVITSVISEIATPTDTR